MGRSAPGGPVDGLWGRRVVDVPAVTGYRESLEIGARGFPVLGIGRQSLLNGESLGAKCSMEWEMVVSRITSAYKNRSACQQP